MTIKPKGAWMAGRIDPYRQMPNTRAISVQIVDGAGPGAAASAAAIFEVLPGGRYRFLGLERPLVTLSAAGRPLFEHTTAASVAKATWKRIWEDDRARRGLYD